MKTGLLWFDDDPAHDLARKVGDAALRYRLKLGRRPNVCYVNPAEKGLTVQKVAGVTVKPLASVLPHHFWVGEEE